MSYAEKERFIKSSCAAFGRRFEKVAGYAIAG
jgi:hypothetical protein